LHAKAPTPHALNEEEIKQFVQDYATAARNAIKAGFDGVEIHAANGYLIDQFWQDTANQRTDRYGGSIENRANFGLEVTRAVVDAIGSSKVGIRLSPWSTFQGMGMKNPIPQFSFIVKELKKFDLAYLHLVESRVSGDDASSAVYHAVTRENDPLIELWGDSPLVLAGGFTPEKAKKVVSEVYTKDNVIIAFGRAFISTPDLPFRIKHGIELTKYDRSTFYLRKDPKGYIDQPFSREWEASQSKL
jgi:NADPH2 dehydrogenase